MPRPIPTPILHFTRVEHLASIIRDGLMSDTAARAVSATSIEIGHPEIKEARRGRPVPIEPGGMVADYVPFYFAPRSPMMLVIHSGSVPGYSAGCGRLVYLRSTLERVSKTEEPVLVTDRNAVKPYARFQPFPGDVEDLVDWPLMQARMWNDTLDYPDRKECRMAEALVHRMVPWDAMLEVATMSEALADEARAIVRSAGASTPVNVRRDWYF